MGVYKTIDIELQELDVEVDFTNADDLFDLVVDSKLSGVKLSELIRKLIVNNVYEYENLRSLMWNEEFVSCLEWHYV